VALLATDVIGVINRDREMHPGERFVLVGHSMGGPVALMVAKQLRQSGVNCIDGVVGVDTLQNAEFTFAKDDVDAMTASVATNFEAGFGNMMSNMLPSSASPEVRQQIMEAANNADHNTAVALMSDFSNIDLKSLFQGAGVPIVCINSAPMGQLGMTTMTEINKKYANFAVILMKGTGHYPQLEDPKVFNADLQQALTMIAAGK
jgi:pimeloyl-ACP methyl ester carboxylesterase